MKGECFKFLLFGWTAAMLAFGLTCLIERSFGDMVWNVWIRLATHSVVEGIPFGIWFKSTGSTLRGFPALVANRTALHYLPLLIQYAALCWLALGSRRTVKRLEGWLLLGGAFLLYIPALAHADAVHVYFGYPLNILLGFWLAREMLGRAKASGSKFVVVGTLSLALFGGLFVSEIFAMKSRIIARISQLPDNWTGINIPRGSSSDKTGDMLLSREMTELHNAIRKHSSPEERLVNLTENAALFFSADRMNLTRYYLGESLYSKAMQREVLSALETADHYLVVTPNPLDLSNRQKEPYTDIAAYIQKNLVQVWKGETMAVWRKE